MNLTTYVDSIRRDLAAAAEIAGDETRAAADRMTAALDSAVRLALLDALSEASSEITRDLAPGSVELRLRAREPEFAVQLPPTGSIPAGPPPPAPPPPPPGEEQGVSRITLRMPESLKSQVEQAAAGEGISVNAWLVRAIEAALSDLSSGRRGSRGRRGPLGIGQQLTGWAR